MDETTPDDKPSDKPKSTLPKLILILTTLCLVVAAGIVFAVRYTGKKMAEKMQAEAMAAAAAVPETPPPPVENPSVTLAKTVLTGSLEERQAALASLIAMEGPQTEAVAILNQAVVSSTESPRGEIISAFGKLAAKNPEVIPTLITSLNDKSLRVEALSALQTAGASAVSSVPALKKIAVNKKESPKIRKAASAAITAIQPPKKPVATRKGTKKKKG